ncbi:hypothetical protein HMPREF9460_02440 [Flavonifractor plautii 1_3_50AFAA]|uniref:Uncharacterized protein n=1 Tax=Flavonifractor plautii 1_3_50AFAA TaxID=742738 RepID=A0A096B768_FLAPL|nr:hypothetical protein HMPREF9460_02440 [Flavonifractor plautii 1_3_50AFAA]
MRAVMPSSAKARDRPLRLCRARNSRKMAAARPHSAGSGTSRQAVRARPSTITSAVRSARKPVGVVPPSHRPVRASRHMLSRTRWAMVSRSSWAKTLAMYIMALPMGVEVSNFSRMQRKATPHPSRRRMRSAKSPTLRLTRSSR